MQSSEKTSPNASMVDEITSKDVVYVILLPEPRQLSSRRFIAPGTAREAGSPVRVHERGRSYRK